MKWYEHDMWKKFEDKLSVTFNVVHKGEAVTLYDSQGFVARATDLHQGLDIARIVESVSRHYATTKDAISKSLS